jgi:hypothetical protein
MGEYDPNRKGTKKPKKKKEKRGNYTAALGLSDGSPFARQHRFVHDAVASVDHAVAWDTSSRHHLPIVTETSRFCGEENSRFCGKKAENGLKKAKKGPKSVNLDDLARDQGAGQDHGLAAHRDAIVGELDDGSRGRLQVL